MSVEGGGGISAGDHSVASVFDYTDSTGYKWASSSSDSEDEDFLDDNGSDDSGKAAVNSAFSKFNMEDLKKAVSGGKKQPEEDKKQKEHWTPLHQSTPAPVAALAGTIGTGHSHQMSGSTIRNDENNNNHDVTMETPSKSNVSGVKSGVQLTGGYDEGEIKKDTLKGTLDSLPSDMQTNVLNYIHRITSTGVNDYNHSSPETEPMATSSPQEFPTVTAQSSEKQQPQYRHHPAPHLESVTDTDPGKPEELNPELESLKSYLRSIPNGDILLENYEKDQKKSITISTEQQQKREYTTTPLGPQSMPDARKKIPQEKKLYYRLGMDSIDNLDDTEAKNMIKNVLLLLGVPLSALPETLSAIVKTLRREDIYYGFANDIHQILYSGDNMQVINDHEQKFCLEKMTKLVTELLNNYKNDNKIKRKKKQQQKC